MKCREWSWNWAIFMHFTPHVTAIQSTSLYQCYVFSHFICMHPPCFNEAVDSTVQLLLYKKKKIVETTELTMRIRVIVSSH